MVTSRNEELLKVALELHEEGIQPVAVSEIRIDESGKKDFFTITKWSGRKTPFTKEEVVKDFSDSRTKNIAIRTDFGITVIDQDKDADEEFVKNYLEPLQDTVIIETPDSGFHYWVATEGLTVKSSTSVLAKNIDVKGKGGIAFIPPSELVLPNGTTKLYRWINDFRDTAIAKPSAQLQELLKNKPGIKTNWGEFFEQENSEGVRNGKTAQAIGKIISKTPYEFWETETWGKVQKWNETKNKPPLEIKELRTVFESIAKKEVANRLTVEKNNSSESQAEMLLDLIDLQKDKFQFFHDEQKNQFVRIKIDEHYEVWKINSQEFNYYLAGLFYKTKKKPINSENLKNALNVLSARAIFEGEIHKLHNRVAPYNKAILYDLCNKDWQGVQVTENGSKIINHLPIVFRRYSHQLPQPLPVNGVDLRDFLKFFNFKNPEDEVLLLVWIVTCFVPDIPHTVLYLHGIQGSAKSTMERLLKNLIDNSSAGLLTLVSNKAELAQMLSHHWLAAFDNVSDLSNEISDTLCRAVSGYSFSKRELYSDDGDIILPIKRCIAINGINMIFTRPDLLERSLLIELEPIPDDKRRTEKEVLKQFENEKASFLGAIFAVLSKAIKIKKSINLSSKPRMADFVEWGCAIAEATGYKRDEFLNAYELNLKLHNEEVINSSLPAQMIVKFMAFKDEWSGTAEDLYNELNRLIERENIKTNKYSWVGSPNGLGRLLNRLKPALEHYGIYISKKHKDRERSICLTRKPIVETVDKQSKPSHNGFNNGNSTDKDDLQSMKDWFRKEFNDD